MFIRGTNYYVKANKLAQKTMSNQYENFREGALFFSQWLCVGVSKTVSGNITKIRYSTRKMDKLWPLKKKKANWQRKNCDLKIIVLEKMLIKVSNIKSGSSKNFAILKARNQSIKANSKNWTCLELKH